MGKISVEVQCGVKSRYSAFRITYTPIFQIFSKLIHPVNVLPITEVQETIVLWLAQRLIRQVYSIWFREFSLWMAHVIQSHWKYWKRISIPKEAVFGFSSTVLILDYGMELYLGLYKVAYGVLFAS